MTTAADPILVSIALDEHGYIVHDANGTPHRASDEAALGALLAELIADDTLPRFRVQKRNDVVSMALSFFRKMFPEHSEHIDAVEPLAHHASELAPKIIRRRRATTARSRSTR